MVSSLSSHVLNVGQAKIEEEPSSLIIPANHTAHFSCKIRCNSTPCSACFWAINNTHFSDQQDLEEQLNDFHAIIEVDNNHCMLVLHVNISEEVNNTTIYCGYGPMGDNESIKYSKTANLLVISRKYPRLPLKT